MSLDPFRSDRLIYRAINLKEDVPFFVTLSADPEAEMATNPNVPKPPRREDTEKFMAKLPDLMLTVIICLPAPIASAPSAAAAATALSTTAEASASTTITTPTPIGMLNLIDRNGGMMPHLRRAMLGLNILKQYQGQGYGTEAIEWGLHWGFHRANLHKIHLGYFGWNEGAGRLYKRLGFIEEARFRDHLWHDGRWWEVIEMGMLEDEWRASRTGKK